MNTHTYLPTPIDTSNIILPASILEASERLAENTHEVWAAQRISEGWKYGLERNEKNKTHPCLVPYSELPDAEKEYDRNTSIEALKVLLALGYEILKKEE